MSRRQVECHNEEAIIAANFTFLLTKVLPNRTLWNSHIDLKYIGNNRRVNIRTRYHEAADTYSGLFFKIWAKM